MADKKQFTKAADIQFTVKFEDGASVKLTVQQIADLKDKRKYDVLDHRGVVIMRKVYRGI